MNVKAVAGLLVTKRAVALAIKKNKIGAGLYMPYGGKIDQGESEEETMCRELFEESGVHCDIADLERIGTLTTSNCTGQGMRRWTISLYTIHSWSGTARETEEMYAPVWFPRSKCSLPLQNMLPADRLWMPKVLAGKYVTVEACYRFPSMQLIKQPWISEMIRLK